MLRRAHRSPGVSPGPARAVLGINPAGFHPHPLSLTSQLLPSLTWAAGAPERSREMREAPEVCRGRAGADPAGIGAPAVRGAQRAQPRRSKLTCSVKGGEKKKKGSGWRARGRPPFLRAPAAEGRS